MRQTQSAISPLREQAEFLAAALPPLLVKAERVANAVTQGVHGRRRVGVGETFWQFRRYGVGDSPSAIDWRRSARSAHLFVRETEWEAAQSVWIWRDGSPSMAYASQSISKLERGSVLALALALLLVEGGERIAAPEIGDLPRTGRLAVRRLAEHYAAHADENVLSLPPEVDVPRYAQFVWLSDFFVDPDEIIARVRKLASAGIKGHLLQILDPAEETFPFAGRVRFSTQEGPGQLLVGRAENLATDYRRKLLEHQDHIRSSIRRLGWTFGIHSTDRAPSAALLSLYAALAGQPGLTAGGRG